MADEESVLRNRLLEDIVNNEGEDGGTAKKAWQPDNLMVLYVTAALFGGFVIAEIVGALVGNSLSLLGDASAMIVDVFTYFSNMYAESVKAKHGSLDPQTRRILEVYIPSFSVCALIGVTIYISTDAVQTIRNKGEGGDPVNVLFLFAFAGANMFVDIVSGIMFYLRGKSALGGQYIAPLRSVSFSLIDEHNNHSHVHDFTSPTGPEGGNTNSHKSFYLPNLNMISALTHVGSDTMRTTAVFVAAILATVTGLNGDVCDATAALVVSCTIVIAVIPLCSEIYGAATRDLPANYIPAHEHPDDHVHVESRLSNSGNSRL